MKCYLWYGRGVTYGGIDEGILMGVHEQVTYGNMGEGSPTGGEMIQGKLHHQHPSTAWVMAPGCWNPGACGSSYRQYMWENVSSRRLGWSVSAS